MGNDKPKHLLIIRLSAMGDVAMVAPVVAAVRRDNPDLRITILTRGFFKPFFRDIPGLEFVTPDLKERHRGLLGIIRLWSQLKAMRIDAVADLHDVLRTKLLRHLLQLGGCRVSVIDKGRFEKRMLTRKFRKIFKPLESTIQRYSEAVARLGIDFREPVPSLRTKREIPQEIIAITGEKTGRWIGVAPFAQHKGKIYPTLLADELIGLLAGTFDRIFLFGGGPYERDFSECMEVRHGGRVVSVIGKVDLSREMDLMANLDVMVTMDTASMHMASLVGTPVISVWGATHPYAGFYGFGQAPADAVQLDLPCRPCSVYGNKRCIFRDYRCLHGIAPRTIYEKVCEKIHNQPLHDQK